MGIIQQAINQTLGTAAIAAKLDPKMETRQQEYKVKQQLGLLEKQASTEMGVEDYLEKKVDTLEDIARINPSEKNVNAFMTGVEELGKERQAMYKANKKIEEANQRAAKIQEEKRLQKEEHEKFLQYFITDPAQVEIAWKGRNK
jgi:hypothetical protein